MLGVDVTMDISLSLVVVWVFLSKFELSVVCIRLLPPISFPGMSCSIFCCGSVIIGTKAEQFWFSSFCEFSWVPCSLNADIFIGCSASLNMVLVVFFAFPSFSISSIGVAENYYLLGFGCCLFFPSFLFCGQTLCG